MKERAPSDIINFQPKIYLKTMKKYKITTFQCGILKLVKIPEKYLKALYGVKAAQKTFLDPSPC